MATRTMSVRLTQSLHDEMSIAAERDDLTVNGFVLDAIRTKLNPSVSAALDTLSLVESADQLTALAAEPKLAFVTPPLLRGIASVLNRAATTWPPR